MFTDFLSEQTAPLKELKKEHDGKSVTVGGVVTDVREILTKKGDKMAFVRVEDKTGEVEIILFPSTYQQTMGVWERDHVVLIHGKVNARDREGRPTDDIKVMVDDAREITAEQAEAYKATGRKPKVPKAGKKRTGPLAMQGPGAKAISENTSPERVYIRLTDAGDNNLLMSLKAAIDENRGSTDVVLVLGPDSSKQAIKLPTGMNNAEPALSKLQSLVGAENVKVR
jgi:DNA polymerase-3 subunit alpha